MDEHEKRIFEQGFRLEEADRALAQQFLRRLEIGEALSEEKIAGGDKLFDRVRDQETARAIADTASTDFGRIALTQLFSQIHSIARKRQYQLLAKTEAAGRMPFIAVDEIEKKNVRVVYQGVEGAYSHAAMLRYFGEDVSNFHVQKWRDAMEAISDGEADYAVLPIENSSAGIVADNFDLLVDFENYIVADQVIRCEHVLMGLPGTPLEEIRSVYSHPQALSQCSQYLDAHREWRQIPFENTAVAARKVARDQDPSQAAIGSEFAAKLFGLEVLARDIYFNEANSTRFIIVTNQRIFRRDAQKISICFELPHTSGSLYDILAHFPFNGLNMNRIESRPIPGRNWEYRFFVDFEGNLASSGVKNALRGIRGEATMMKILGNY